MEEAFCEALAAGLRPELRIVDDGARMFSDCSQFVIGVYGFTLWFLDVYQPMA